MFVSMLRSHKRKRGNLANLETRIVFLAFEAMDEHMVTISPRNPKPQEDYFY